MKIKWKDPHVELPNEKDGFGMICMGHCKISKFGNEVNIYLQVYFDPTKGWFTFEDHTLITVSDWFYINELF